MDIQLWKPLPHSLLCPGRAIFHHHHLKVTIGLPAQTLQCMRQHLRARMRAHNNTYKRWSSKGMQNILPANTTVCQDILQRFTSFLTLQEKALPQHAGHLFHQSLAYPGKMARRAQHTQVSPPRCTPLCGVAPPPAKQVFPHRFPAISGKPVLLHRALYFGKRTITHPIPCSTKPGRKIHHRGLVRQGMAQPAHCMEYRLPYSHRPPYGLATL